MNSRHEGETAPGTKFEVQVEDTDHGLDVNIWFNDGATILMLEELREVVRFAEYHGAADWRKAPCP